MRISYISEAAVLMLPPRQGTAIVSITEPGREAPLPCPEGWGALLRIQFADAEYDGGTIARLKARGKPFNAESKGFPCRRTTKALHAFFDALASQTAINELIVHCHAGQRRSAAVAKFASERFNASFDHDYVGYNKTVYALLKNPTLYEQTTPRTFLAWVFGIALAIVGCSNSASIPTTPPDIDIAESIPYCTGIENGESKALLLDMAHPKGQSGDLPVVLLIHGGGWVGGSRTDYRYLLNALAQQQLVTVSVDYRLAPTSVFPAQVHDVKCAVRWIRANARRYKMDTRRIVAIGASAGAHLAAFVGATTGISQFEGTGGFPMESSKIDAMVLHAGVYALGPLASELSNNPTPESANGLKAMAMLLGGNEDFTSPAYATASPASYASSGTVPSLILHGRNDTLIPYTEALRFGALLQSKGASSAVFIIEGAGHGDFSTNPDPAIQRLVAFVKGIPIPTPRNL